MSNKVNRIVIESILPINNITRIQSVSLEFSSHSYRILLQDSLCETIPNLLLRVKFYTHFILYHSFSLRSYLVFCYVVGFISENPIDSSISLHSHFETISTTWLRYLGLPIPNASLALKFWVILLTSLLVDKETS